MGRGPCCEKMGLKKGPWSSEEDRILITYIQSHGHPNWRALPKQAGLLRCGKSCRLRWTNYLRPDIKRGNFTPEEESTIFHLHHLLGNRWSAIAARLPGRTDNEIKNVWHTHLKKRLPLNQQSLPTTNRNPKHIKQNPVTSSSSDDDDDTVIKTLSHQLLCHGNAPPSPPQLSVSISDTSTLTTTANIEPNSNSMSTNDVQTLTHNIESLDEDFWSEVLSADNSGESSQLAGVGAYAADPRFQFPLSPVSGEASICDGFNMEFWGDHVYTRAHELTELLLQL